MRPKLYTIAPERPFLAVLAEGLLAMGGSDPLALSRVTVLLPTRRAVRALRDAFLRTAPDGKEPGTPLLLPRMRSIGGLDSDELSVVEGIADGDGLSVPPAIPELRRRLLLTQLVLKWGRQGGRGPLLPGEAAALATSLARLLDTVAAEGASFARLRELAPPDLAEHWEVVRKFLEILPYAWPGMLAAEGALDPADRRNRLLARQAAIWRRTPPRDPVVAAGLTGGIPAMTELIRVVASLDNGAVILHGLDRRCDAAEWAAIERDEAHPQYLLASLLRALDMAPPDIRDWPEPASDQVRHDSTSARRLRLVGEAMRPAATTDAWRDLPRFSADALAGLSRYDCAGAHEEALTVALLLRRKLETPGATAALVTPDRELARRVAAELARWGIAIDDSAGLPLNRTPPGVFLRLVLDLAASELAPVPLLAALKHPLAAGGLAPVAFRDLTRRLEQAIRGPRPAPGFAGLRAALTGNDAERLRPFAGRLEACLGALPGLLAADVVPLAQLATAHLEAAERLAATDEEPGGNRLWREAAGETAARFYNELIDAAGDFPPLPGRHYPALFEALAAGAVVRPLYGRHPRLAIWGLVEARLQQADLVVLGGLNEGGWPGPAAHDPWMSRQMRREFGIAVPERAIGIAAHDFAQAIAAPEAVLTRAARSEGVPTVPSRWLLRLDTVLRAVGLDGALRPDPTIEHAVYGLDAAAYRQLPPAEPRPPLAARPRQLSVTQIETWLQDPYAIYARHILQLRALRGTRRRSRPRRSRDLRPRSARRVRPPLSARLARRSCRGVAGDRAPAFWRGVVEARCLGFLVAALRAHRPMARRGGGGAPRGDDRKLWRAQGQPDIGRAARRVVRADRNGRPHRPARNGRISADRLQDRRHTAQTDHSRRLCPATAARRRRSYATAALARSAARPRRSNIGSSAAACPQGSAARSTTATPPAWSTVRSPSCAPWSNASTTPRLPTSPFQWRRAGRGFPITSIWNASGAARSKNGRRGPHPHGTSGGSSARLGVGRGVGRDWQDDGADRSAAAADARRDRSGAHPVPDLYPRRRGRNGEPARHRAGKMGDVAPTAPWRRRCGS